MLCVVCARLFDSVFVCLCVCVVFVVCVVCRVCCVGLVCVFAWLYVCDDGVIVCVAGLSWLRVC